MNYRILFCAFALTISSLLHAQVKISGTILDAENKPVSGATIAILSKSSAKPSFQIVSNQKGFFNAAVSENATYSLNITYVGFEDLKKKVIVENANVETGVITLKVSTALLSEVTVKVKKAAVKQKADTLEFSASAYKVNPDATAEDLVRKLPGVSTEGGVVKAQGEEVKKVTIDGKEFFGDDATAALKNLPAEIIDKIQVFDRMSDQSQLTGFDDGNAVKAINIITKAEMRNGRFGRVSAGYGTGSTYNTGGNLSYYSGKQRISLLGLANNVNQQNFSFQDIIGISQSNGKKDKKAKAGATGADGALAGKNAANFAVGPQNGINSTTATGINFSDMLGKKVELTASYFFNHSSNNNEEFSNRNTLLTGDSSITYQENRLSSGSNNTHRFNLKTEYKIDSFNALIFTSKDNIQNSRSTDDFTGNNFYNETSSVSNIISSRTNVGTGSHLNNALLLKHQFGLKGRSLVIGFSNVIDKSDGEINLRNINAFTGSGLVTTDSLNQHINQVKKANDLSADISYTEPVGKNCILLLHFSPSTVNETFTRNAYSSDYTSSKYSVLDSSLSSSFTSRYNGQQGGLSYRMGSKENMFSAGLEYRAGRLEGGNLFQAAPLTKKYFNLLPEMNWKMRVSPRSNIKVEYHSSVDLPSIDKLQDVINNSEPLFYTRGNTGLVEQTSNKLSGRYSFINTNSGNSFFANFSTQKVDNYITNASYTATSDTLLENGIVLKKGSQLSMPVNLDGYFNVRSLFTYSMPFKQIKSTVNWNGGIAFVRTPGLVNGIKNLSEGYNYSAGAMLVSNISSFIDFTLSYSANLNQITNSIKPGIVNSYFSQVIGMRVNLLSANGWLFQNDLTNQSYKGLTAGYNQNFCLWNMSGGKKFLKKQAGEVKLSVFDLLKQNRNILRTVTETYVEDVRSKVLQQYFMLTFTYRFKAFGGSR